MKVLFAVNNDDISDAILKKYQKNYREILSYKNVYYFNAILKELQKDKTYDRVVISEDLEPFANNNYDAIDKFLFEKLDNISDEAINEEGNNTDIIFICSDRRTKSDNMLSRLFSLGIYSAMIGQDRSTDEVCRLINKPRTKKEAKQYYNIEVDNVNYQTESEDNVSEAEVQNILAHYKRLGKNEDKYVDSFNNIVSQYNDEQLKIIIRYLPISVKAVLEEKSPKYQQLASFSYNNVKTKKANQLNKNKNQNYKKADSIQVEMLENESDKNKITRPIVIPSEVNKQQVRKLIKEVKPQANIMPSIEESLIDIDDSKELNKEVESSEAKRGRGRPRKILSEEEQKEDKPKRGRGRPRKNPIAEEIQEKQEDDELIDLFSIDSEVSANETTSSQDDSIDLFNLEQDEFIEEKVKQDEYSDLDDSMDLFNLVDDKKIEKGSKEEDEEINLFDLVSDDESKEDNFIEVEENVHSFNNQNNQPNVETKVTQTQYNPIDSFNLATSLTKDKKVVCFVGTTKNGTSFIVNNAAHLLASMGISTAILDITKTKNAYYIYTNSEEQLMKTAKESIYKLKSGIAEGIKVNKNLTVYTSLPEDQKDYTDVDNILSTLVKNYSVVLIDCDFDTPMEYFGAAQEIYLVQSMDVLTIQPLTAFLRNMQSRGVLRQEKLKIVINKSVNIRSVPIKTLIGGISKYNDPSMSYMKDLFDKDMVSYCVIPFEVQNYIKYLDSLITCTISLNGYSKTFINALKQLCNMIYPLINKQTYSPRGDKYKSNFTNEMNDTLNKMKRKYN